MQPIPSESFYGNVQRDFLPPVAEAQARMRILNFLTEHSHIEQFTTQQKAIDYIDEHPTRRLNLFAVEFDSSGKRKYLASTIEAIWMCCQRLRSEGAETHFYEVIREGASCKLYFDTEFATSTNPNCIGELMIDALLRETTALLREQFPVLMKSVTLDMHSVLEMDSSTPSKFSRHVVAPGVVFRTNEEMGKFVRQVCRIVQEKQPDLMTVSSKDNVSKTTFVDQGVYTKNRCFRMLGSSKYAKKTTLEFSERSPYFSMFHEDVFTLSLVVNVPPLSLCLHLDPVSEVELRHEKAAAVLASGSLSKFGPSPFPSIDNFIKKLVVDEHRRGYIRSWVYFSSSAVLTFSIAGSYRFCHNIGRHHTSNNVYFVADLARAEIVQRCYDPDCRYFQSIPWPIPKHRSVAWDVTDEMLHSIDPERVGEPNLKQQNIAKEEADPSSDPFYVTDEMMNSAVTNGAPAPTEVTDEMLLSLATELDDP